MTTLRVLPLLEFRYNPQLSALVRDVEHRFLLDTSLGGQRDLLRYVSDLKLGAANEWYGDTCDKLLRLLMEFFCLTVWLAVETHDRDVVEREMVFAIGGDSQQFHPLFKSCTSVSSSVRDFSSGSHDLKRRCLEIFMRHLESDELRGAGSAYGRVTGLLSRGAL